MLTPIVWGADTLIVAEALFVPSATLTAVTM
jgi:hypothetical protein